MAITLNLPPEVEASLAAQARALGLPLNSYVQSLLEQQAGLGVRSKPQVWSNLRPNSTPSPRVPINSPTYRPRP